jgi:hypothetical protein
MGGGLLRTAPCVTALAGVLGCRTPTTIRVDAYSEVDCAQKPVVGISISRDVASIGDARIVSRATACDGATGLVGSLVVAPLAGSQDDAPVVLEVVTNARGEAPEACATGAQGCIRASRALRFSPHDEVRLRVDLRLSCTDVVCATG